MEEPTVPTTAPQTAEWVTRRVDGMIGLLERYDQHDIRVEHKRDPDLAGEHRFLFYTSAYEENGKPLGYNRLTVSHPSGCDCAVESA
jgi:hypothetical protein